MHAYVIGNVTIDETIAVAEMPTAGASILGRQRSRDLGGKGANQAVVMARCGVATSLISATGDDFRAGSIRERLAREAVHSELVTLPEATSDFSVVLITPDGENANITTTESAQGLSTAQACKALAAAEAGDFAVLQGNLSDATTRGTLEEARARGLTTAFNPSPVRAFFSGFWHLVDIAFLNEGESRLLTGTTGEAAARYLMTAGVKQVVLTFGGDGAMLATSEGMVRVPAFSCPVIDTTGAGDTFMAVALASAGLRGVRLDRRAIEDATRAAAVTVGRYGTLSAFPTAEELAGILAPR